ncbi:MAG: Fic family protein [Polyangiaceae bacterium]|nr:Fic family protein [Polyangiaceae bacterium]
MTSFGWDFPSQGELTELHEMALANFGGAASPPKEGCVDRSIASAINASLYSADDDAEPDLLLAAAHLLFYVAKNHCFTDGNKRAAWAAVVRAFDLNGIRIEADPDDAAELVEGVASGARTVRDILLWFYEPGRIRARE